MIKEIDNITIDIISTKLKDIVSPLDIIKWLNNFEKDEIKYAVDIAANITVFTNNEIIEIINSSFNCLFPRFQENEMLIVNPVGNFGKSGSMVTYFFQKTDFYRNNKEQVRMIPTIEDLSMEEDLNYKLVLIDDFVGSGNSVKTYYEKRIRPLKNIYEEIYFVGVAGIKQGVKLIETIFDEVRIPESNIFKKAFSSEASYFGYRNYSEHRKFCYKYGIQLTTPKVRKDNSKKYVNALGYDNSQALVSFSHGSPNNTLPIIWANNNNWFPLIPRFFSDKISVSKRFRKSISYELSMLKEFGSENLQSQFFNYKIKKAGKTFSSVSKLDFSIYTIIKLMRLGYSSINICQKLGILSNDYDEMLVKGKESGIFYEGNKLTLFGLELYQDAKKCIDRKKKNFEYEFADFFAVRDINYIPKQFNGRS